MITTTGLTRIYGKGENAVTAVNNLDIRIDDGELIAITGKSGSGKTTLLNILGGLDKATGGSVCYDDTDITKLADTALADFRLNKIGFVFQFYDLIPELTAKENILLPSKLAKKGKTDISDTVKKLGVENLLGRYPSELSGGMRQRVSFARTLVQLWHGRELMLLDEPFSALDSLTRISMQDWLIGQVKGLDATVMMVTHDVEEAMLVGNKIFLLSGRPVKQIKVIDVSHITCREDLYTPSSVELKNELVRAFLTEKAERGDNI